MADLRAMYFCVGDKRTNVCSYVWRLGWSATSFYIKPQYAALSALKVSLHGPDPRHNRSGFKLAEDISAASKAKAAGGVMVASPGMLPLWFPGHTVSEGISHVLRFRVPWDLLSAGVPTAPLPTELRTRAIGGVVAPPIPLHAVDVDIYMSDRQPYWPNERRARADNACMGPLRNKANQQLTAVAVHRLMLSVPVPSAARGPEPLAVADRVRGLGAAVDELGFVWVAEQWLSRSALQGHES